MKLFNALLGNASRTDSFSTQADIEHLIIDGEFVEQSYRVIRDLFVFTNKRLFIIDVQGVSGKKTLHHSISYDQISHFTIETAGMLNLESKLVIQLISGATFYQVFDRGNTIIEVQRALADHIFQNKYVLGIRS